LDTIIKIRIQIINIQKICESYYSNILNSESTSSNSNTIKSLTLPFILSLVNLDISNTAPQLLQLSKWVFILTLVCLLSLLNVFFYGISYVLIAQYDLQNKFPRLKKIIIYYKNSNLIFMVIEAILGFSILNIFNHYVAIIYFILY